MSSASNARAHDDALKGRHRAPAQEAVDAKATTDEPRGGTGASPSHVERSPQRAGDGRSAARQAKRLQDILDSIGEGVVVADEHGAFTQFNPAAAKILGIGSLDSAPERWSADYGLFLPDQVTPCPVDQLPLARALRGERVDEFELFVRNAQLPNGVWLSVTATPLVDEENRLRGGVAAFRDISEKKRIEAAREAKERALRCMIEAHERNQKLTAFEIHDGMAQDIQGALLAVEAMRAGGGLDESTLEKLDQLRQQLQNAMEEARGLVAGLRPHAIDEHGVVAAIDEWISSSARLKELVVEFNHDSHTRRYAPLLETTVFRVAQEALTNVERHSGSRRARVALNDLGDKIVVEIEDWGSGFDTRNAPSSRYGLQGIHERSRLLGGWAEVESSPGGGTRVRVTLPYMPCDGQD